MSNKDLWQAIESRDLTQIVGLMRMATGPATWDEKVTQYTNCDICDSRPGHRAMNSSGVEGVICLECEAAADLRARLSLEQRDEPKEGGANTWQDRDADEYGVPRTGPI